MIATHLPEQNTLLRAMTPQCRKRIYPEMKLVKLKLGFVLDEAGSTLKYAYFPTNSIISILYVMESGASAEIAVVGNEGVVGVALFMGGGTTLTRAVTQNAGHAYRMKAKFLKDEFARSGVFQQLMLRYSLSLLSQMTQTAACNRHHSVEQQFCRWLLLSLDRLPANEVRMTQRLIANMLGIKPAAVILATQRLQTKGVIEYHHGHITVLDRPKLEKACCECYDVVKRELDRLLPCSQMRH